MIKYIYLCIILCLKDLQDLSLNFSILLYHIPHTHYLNNSIGPLTGELKCIMFKNNILILFVQDLIYIKFEK
jgi:hypothetical protein